MSEDDLLRTAAFLLDEPTAHEIAGVYSDEVVFPARVMIEEGGSTTSFPLWGGRVLVLSHENQGVCSWGLSLDGPSAGAVLVGGDLPGAEETTVYASSLAAFVETRRWDGRCLTREPLLQAQAQPLDEGSLRYLQEGFDQGITTRGWPCERNHRFERDELMIMLWACADQCDWWVSGPVDAVRTILADLRRLSDLGGRCGQTTTSASHSSPRREASSFWARARSLRGFGTA